jgi:C-terminal processing protease CtpA/Prc
MKKSRLVWVLLLAVMIGCSDSSPTNPDPDPDNQNNEEASDEKQFVWNAMNYWYYWQSDVTELGDNYLDDNPNFLQDFTDSEALFESFRHPDDDFSFFIDDYEEYQNEQDGIYAALGLNYGFVRFDPQSAEVFGYVRYVIPGSPADEAGLERLDLFSKVDGTTITIDNFRDLLTNNSPHDLTLASIDTTGPSFQFVEEETISVESRQVIEDPIFASTVIDTGGVKIGYLMYNAFQTNSHQDLNDVFADFNSQGIDELVLDLRYNGGGSVLTSQLLSSQISGLSSNDLYATLAYSEKRDDRSRDLFFLEQLPVENEQGNFEDSGPVNSVDLPRLYVLTSSSTASASEAVINSLQAYMDVTVIGSKTVGKDEGSLTLYDAPEPYLDDSQANPDHKKAIQPIVTKIVNSQDADYPNGFAPDGYSQDGCVDNPNDNCVPELTLNNLVSKPKLGSTDEPLLSRSIDVIIGPLAKQVEAEHQITMDELPLRTAFDAFKPHRQGMHIEPYMVPAEQN